jgi:hypothetical protein
VVGEIKRFVDNKIRIRKELTGKNSISAKSTFTHDRRRMSN